MVVLLKNSKVKTMVVPIGLEYKINEDKIRFVISQRSFKFNFGEGNEAYVKVDSLSEDSAKNAESKIARLTQSMTLPSYRIFRLFWQRHRCD